MTNCGNRNEETRMKKRELKVARDRRVAHVTTSNLYQFYSVLRCFLNTRGEPTIHFKLFNSH